MSLTLIAVLLLPVVAVLAAGIKIVPPGMALTVDRFGRYYRALGPGWHFIVPFIDSAHPRRPGDGSPDVT